MKKHVSIEELYQLFINCNQKITTDTRKLEKGAIFFALRGDNFNANTFAKQAIEAGCAYAIVDDVSVCNNEQLFLVENVLETLQQLAKFHRQQLKYPIIGITGSNGKTTNKELIHAVLAKKYNTYATIGNLNNHIGVPLTLLALTHQHEMAIVEMGANHQGEIAMLCELSNPDFGLITNIGKAHLEGFGGEEGVKKGKSELYKFIENKKGKIFINGNDDVLLELAKNLEKIYYGENIDFDTHGKIVSKTECVEFKWNTKLEDIEQEPIVKTNMYGNYNFINLLCAACVGNYFGVNKNDINAALASYVPEMNRSQIKKTKSNTIILDAYNANPSSMYSAIDNFQRQNTKNKIMILGDMFELGDFSYNEHETVLKQLINGDVKNVILIGMQFCQLKDKYLTFRFFETISDFEKHIKPNEILDSTILIKGSRGMKLEKIVDLL